MGAVTVRGCRGGAEFPLLAEIWRRAVDATHDFLADADRDAIEGRLVAEFLPAVVLSVAEVDGRVVGFSGVLGEKVEMLFVDPAVHGTGVGTALLERVVAEHGVTEVDVNEQNGQAVRFYDRRGFEVVGRSETDDEGRPYPLLHLRLTTRG